MWYLAGDKSTDYNFYTKRLILSGILFKLYLKYNFLEIYYNLRKERTLLRQKFFQIKCI